MQSESRDSLMAEDALCGTRDEPCSLRKTPTARSSACMRTRDSGCCIRIAFVMLCLANSVTFTCWRICHTFPITWLSLPSYMLGKTIVRLKSLCMIQKDGAR